jgi:hypothetical protein
VISNDETVSAGGGRMLDGSEDDGARYDDDNGPAALPPSYEGPQPTAPDVGLAPVAMRPLPVLTDASGGIAANAPKGPGTPTTSVAVPSHALAPTSAAPAPVLVDEKRVTRTIFDVRLVALGVVFAIIMLVSGSLQRSK